MIQYNFLHKENFRQEVMEDKENNPTGVKAHGAIVKIVFSNFLFVSYVRNVLKVTFSTYDRATCVPGPFLNVIIGPNGTGKSTIICGICLAVGGSPNILGRSDNIADFIKHGKDEGFVEIHLWDSRRRIARLFKISIKRPKSKTYFIDGKIVTHKDHVSEIRKYNIQVDNPCTFLAQDKVKSFAEQGSRTMLENTEKAGPEELLKKHIELESFFKEGDSCKEQLERNKKRLENIQGNLKTVKARAKNYEERERRGVRINLLKQRKALLKFEENQDRLVASNKELNKAEKDLLKAQHQKNPLESKIIKMKESRVKSENIIANAKNEQSQRFLKINQLLESLSIEDKMVENAQEFNRVQRQHADWDEDIIKTGAEKKTFEDLLARARLDIVPNPAFERSTQELKNLEKNKDRLEKEWRTQIEQLHSRKAEIERAKNNEKRQFDRKLQHLFQTMRAEDYSVAWDFYQSNRKKFRTPVFVPLLHMNVPSEENMRLLNNIIGIRDMGMFIFGCKEDEDFLLSHIKPRRVNTTIIGRDMLAEFDGRRQLPEELVAMGFRELACNLFDAPLPVRAHLCSCSVLDRIPIGGQSVDDHSEAIGQKIGRQFGVFLTNKCRVSVVFSRYNGQVSTKRSELRPNGPICEIHACKTLDVETEERKLQEAADMNNQQRIAFEEEKDRYEETLRNYRAAEKNIFEKKNKVTMLEDKLSRINARLEDSAAQKPNINAARAAFEERKKLLAKEAIGNLAKLAAQVNSHRLALRGCLFASTESSYFKRKLIELEDQLETLLESTGDIQKNYDDARRNNDKLKREISELKKTLLDTVNSEGSREKVTLQGLRALLEEKEIPTDIELIESQIAEERGRLDIGRADGTQLDVEEFMKLQKEELDVNKELDKLHGNRADWQEIMDQKLDEWVDPLKALVDKISKNYSKFFTGLGCQGEVRLEIPDDKYNISQYGITIYVKFREETTLRPLTHQVQSGGERSVATMLYLMALQDLCPVPFRCVDEINQGMDPNNERKVFNMMVQLLSGGGQLSKTQYFLLTPKLLGGLEFNEQVTVHIVHNGPALSNVEFWDPEKFLCSQ